MMETEIISKFIYYGDNIADDLCQLFDDRILI